MAPHCSDRIFVLSPRPVQVIGEIRVESPRTAMSAAEARIDRLPLARHPLRFSDLIGRHLGSHLIAILDRHLAKIGVCCGRRSQVEPHVGQRIVLRHAKAAVLVRHAEVELCVGKSLVRSKESSK